MPAGLRPVKDALFLGTVLALVLLCLLLSLCCALVVPSNSSFPVSCSCGHLTLTLFFPRAVDSFAEWHRQDPRVWLVVFGPVLDDSYCAAVSCKIAGLSGGKYAKGEGASKGVRPSLSFLIFFPPLVVLRPALSREDCLSAMAEAGAVVNSSVGKEMWAKLQHFLCSYVVAVAFSVKLSSLSLFIYIYISLSSYIHFYLALFMLSLHLALSLKLISFSSYYHFFFVFTPLFSHFLCGCARCAYR